MTDFGTPRVALRRAAVEREILDQAWAVMAREGVAAVSVREVARAVGLRQQSLTYYFATKQHLLDAMFADGFADLAAILEALPEARDPVDGVVDVAEAVAGYCVAHPARYHLMFQRTVPGFAPSAPSHDTALRCLRVLERRLTAARVTALPDVALVRGIISGLAAEQIANDPHGRQYVDQVGRGVRTVLAAVAVGRPSRRKAAPGSPTRTNRT